MSAEPEAIKAIRAAVDRGRHVSKRGTTGSHARAEGPGWSCRLVQVGAHAEVRS